MSWRFNIMRARHQKKNAAATDNSFHHVDMHECGLTRVTLQYLCL